MLAARKTLGITSARELLSKGRERVSELATWVLFLVPVPFPVCKSSGERTADLALWGH